MRIRTAAPAEALDVRRIVDAAMLVPGDVETRIDGGDVLVAVEERSGRDDRLLAALVLSPREYGAHVAAVAVRRRLRGRGIGAALVERALQREHRLTARFDADVRPFYESLGFAIESIGGDRYRGVRRLDSRSETR